MTTRAIAGIRSSRKKREPNDFYRTPPHCTEKLIEREGFSGPIWEPACGDGLISRVLIGAGYDVISTDLIDRGYGQARVDFLMEWTAPAPNIVTNPPFALADRFVLQALNLGVRKLCLLLPVRYEEGQDRYRDIWRQHPYARKHVFSERPTLWRGDEEQPADAQGTVAYAWFVWDADYSGPPLTFWIAPDTLR